MKVHERFGWAFNLQAESHLAAVAQENRDVIRDARSFRLSFCTSFHGLVDDGTLW